MPLPRPKSLFARAVLAAAAFCGASASHAAIYTGQWDPAYGGIFPSLGWSATALFNVPTACLALGDGTYSTSQPECSGLGFQSADVSFYNSNDLSKTILETYQLANVGSVGGSVTIAANEVTGVESSTYFAPFVPDPLGAASSIDGAGAYSFNFIMQDNAEAQLRYVPSSSTIADCERREISCGFSETAAVGVFAVPEPSSVALVLAGLGGIALAGRRRSAAVVTQ